MAKKERCKGLIYANGQALARKYTDSACNILFRRGYVQQLNHVLLLLAE